MSAVASFVIASAVQLFLFVAHATLTKQRHNIKKFLLYGCSIGIVFGPPFDLLFGKYLGLYDLSLGFQFPALFYIGFFSYGLMLSHALLFRNFNTGRFYVHVVGLGVVYETVNLVAPVWEYTFAPTAWQEFALVFALAYSSLAFLLLLTSRIVYGVRVAVIPV